MPVCSGNRPDGDDALCNAAVESCPAEDEIRVWVFTRRVNRITGRPLTPWRRVTDPSTTCVGPTEPDIDPVVLVPAIVNRDFQRVVVLKGTAEVSPRPDTLVNIPTVFTTGAPPTYEIPVRVLGQRVLITVTAESWTWHFGDGRTATTAAKGARGRIEHVYERPARREAYVVIEWSGTFTVNGGQPQAVVGRATTTGDPVAVQVKQARSEELVAG